MPMQARQDRLEQPRYPRGRGLQLQTLLLERQLGLQLQGVTWVGLVRNHLRVLVQLRVSIQLLVGVAWVLHLRSWQ